METTNIIKTYNNCIDLLSPIPLKYSLISADNVLKVLKKIVASSYSYWMKYTGCGIHIVDDTFDKIILDIIHSMNKYLVPRNNILDNLCKNIISNQGVKKILKLFNNKVMLDHINILENENKPYIVIIVSKDDTMTLLLGLKNVAMQALDDVPQDIICGIAYNKSEYDEQVDPFAPHNNNLTFREHLSRKICMWCYKENSKYRCANCCSYYCDKNHQSLDWKKRHSKLCNIWRYIKIFLFNSEDNKVI